MLQCRYVFQKFRAEIEAKKAAAKAKKGEEAETAAELESKKAEEAEESEKISVQPEAGAIEDDELSKGGDRLKCFGRC